jgi:hypothetical protein
MLLVAQRDTQRRARLAGGGPAREPPAPSGDEGKACTAPGGPPRGVGRARALQRCPSGPPNSRSRGA